MIVVPVGTFFRQEANGDNMHFLMHPPGGEQVPQSHIDVAKFNHLVKMESLSRTVRGRIQ